MREITENLSECLKVLTTINLVDLFALSEAALTDLLI